MKYQKITKLKAKSHVALICSKIGDLKTLNLSKSEIDYVKKKWDDEETVVEINQYSNHYFLVKVKKESDATLFNESVRIIGHSIGDLANKNKIDSIVVAGEKSTEVALLVEGMVLGNYQFLKYFKDKKKNSLNKIEVLCSAMKKVELDKLGSLCEAVYHTRDLVNEPLSYLTAVQLSKEIQKMSKTSGFNVKVLNKKKIEELKMGGLLAVNRGSIDPPTFTIIEWKPKNAKNKKPIVLVGKGVVYDTGGLSLKPTANSMDFMKSDMGGAAMMVGTMYAVAKNEVPMHVIALIPATDNRPGQNAYAPGDVVKMHSGLNVEVLNTDAEGRMLLADALHYAKKYKPELVLDSATLTGAAVRAFGPFASCVMGTASDGEFNQLEKSANETFERVIRMPFWKEYGDSLKSDIADMKNLGGAYGGHISAGKFLERFTDYPWIHIDIAGPAYLMAPDQYRPKCGTGYGVRLLYDFISGKAK